MPTITSLGIKVTGNAKEFAAEAQKVAGIANSLASQLQNLQGALGGIHSTLLKAPSETARKTVDHLSRAVRNLWAGLKAVEGIKWATRLTVETERASLVWGVMLKDQQKAMQLQTALRDMVAQGKAGPFDLQTLQSAAHQLLVYKFEAQDILPIMKLLVDAAAAFPEAPAESMERMIRAFGQMKAKGRVQAEEMRQLAELGINAWDAIANRLGVTVPEAMKRVHNNSVSSAIGIAAVLESIEKQFSGVAEARAKTLEGRFMKMAAGMQIALSSGVSSFIERSQLSRMMEELGDYLRTNSGLLRDFGYAVGTVFQGLVKYLKPVVPFLYGIHSGFRSIISPVIIDGLKAISSILESWVGITEQYNLTLLGSLFSLEVLKAAQHTAVRTPAHVLNVLVERIAKGMQVVATPFDAAYLYLAEGRAHAWDEAVRRTEAAMALHDAKIAGTVESLWNKENDPVIRWLNRKQAELKEQHILSRKITDWKSFEDRLTALRNVNVGMPEEKMYARLHTTSVVMRQFSEGLVAVAKSYGRIAVSAKSAVDEITIAQKAMEDQKRIEFQASAEKWVGAALEKWKLYREEVERTLTPLEKFGRSMRDLSKFNPFMTQSVRIRAIGKAYEDLLSAYNLGERKDNKAIKIGTEDYRALLADVFHQQQTANPAEILKQIEALDREQNEHLKRIYEELRSIGVVKF